MKTAYAVWEQTQITYASALSEQRPFISCFDSIKYMVAISEITRLYLSRPVRVLTSRTTPKAVY